MYSGVRIRSAFPKPALRRPATAAGASGASGASARGPAAVESRLRRESATTLSLPTTGNTAWETGAGMTLIVNTNLYLH